MLNKKELFNENWSFVKQIVDNNTDIAVYHEAPESFQAVTIPHDWLIEDAQALYQPSIGWYKKTYNHEEDNENVLIKFDGVYMESFLYVNGQCAGTWKNGYTSFTVDISPYLEIGANELLLKVVYQSPNSRWYTGAGIYRNVWKIEAGPVYLLDEDVYIHTEKLNENCWEIQLEIETNVVSDYSVSAELMDNNLKLVSQKEFLNDQQKVSLIMQVEDVECWSPTNPKLFDLNISLVDTLGTVIQQLSSKIGFKEVILSPIEGMRLNGEKFKIQGVCEHHDLGSLGAAFNVEVMRQRLLQLKEMGVNAIRTAHNVPAPELMHLADEFGFLILSEAFDIWRKSKTKFDYARFFDEYSEADVIRWIKRDRNHTSLFMWSIGNEIYDTHESEAGFDTAQKLLKLVQKIDYKGNAVVSLCSNYMPWSNTQRVADMIKVVGYNYGEKYFDEHHEKYPDWVIYGSETAALVQSRGVYHFPLEASVLADDDEQCSSLGNSSTSWGAKSVESLINHYAAKEEYALGQFIWTGFDYIGEPTPYHTKNAYFGQIDTAGFEKDTYYMYKAAWTDYTTKPFVHIFPHWDFNIGQTIDVRVASNAPFVELFLNGESLGKQASAYTQAGFVIPSWKVSYVPGTIHAVAYDREGKQIAKGHHETFGESAKVKLQANKPQLVADGKDTILVDIVCLDSQAREVRNASNRINIRVEGAGTLIGLDNGDSTDYDSYKGPSKRMFNGKLRAFVQATTMAGQIEVIVTSPGMEEARMSIRTVPVADDTNGVNSSHSYSEIIDYTPESEPHQNRSMQEIPIRKIDLIMIEGANALTPTDASVQLKATILPSNSSYSELEWRLVEKNGAPTSKARLTQLNQSEIKVSAIADGEFKVRCLSKNGSSTNRIISEMDMSVTGFGVDYKDAYHLIIASKADYQTDNITNGNEKGIATARGEASVVGYHFVDFGDAYVDTIELPIFALDDKSYTIEIFDGHPDKQDTQLLVAGIYQKPSKWNTYQNETFKLNKRLSKVQQIYIRTHDKVHVKGFVFYKAMDVNKVINITSSDFVYGDSFEQFSDRIEHIGNNVSIVFEKIQLGESPIETIRIHGSTPNKVNTILFKFKTDEKIFEHNVEFLQCSDYEIQEFEIPNWKGDGELTAVFLPGSNFNFKSIEFVTKGSSSNNETK